MGFHTQSSFVLTRPYYPANAHYPRHPTSGKGERSKDKSTTKRSKDALTEVQGSLEEAAITVTEIDERLSKELGNNASSETYVKLTLSRLQPFLLYFVHRGPHEVSLTRM